MKMLVDVFVVPFRELEPGDMVPLEDLTVSTVLAAPEQAGDEIVDAKWVCRTDRGEIFTHQPDMTTTMYRSRP